VARRVRSILCSSPWAPRYSGGAASRVEELHPRNPEPRRKTPGLCISSGRQRGVRGTMSRCQRNLSVTRQLKCENPSAYKYFDMLRGNRRSLLLLAGIACAGILFVAVAQETPRAEPPSAVIRMPSTVSPRMSPRQPAARVAPETIGSTVAVKCGNGTSYKLATGSNAGVCKIYVENGGVTGGLCTDGTNSALQTCATGCGQVMGSGTCEKQEPNSTEPQR